MMITIITIASIIQAMSVSLGVGSSTLAILGFFKAITDGTIDASERGIMSMTYIVLRISMILILFTTAIILSYNIVSKGASVMNGYIYAQIVLVIILFINATLMTMRIMPSTFGPAIQASSWYSLGFIFSLYSLGLANFSLSTFLLGQAIFVLFVVGLVNSVMYHLKHQIPATKV